MRRWGSRRLWGAILPFSRASSLPVLNSNLGPGQGRAALISSWGVLPVDSGGSWAVFRLHRRQGSRMAGRITVGSEFYDGVCTPIYSCPIAFDAERLSLNSGKRA
jgi:hypothetical protein